MLPRERPHPRRPPPPLRLPGWRRPGRPRGLRVERHQPSPPSTCPWAWPTPRPTPPTWPCRRASPKRSSTLASFPWSRPARWARPPSTWSRSRRLWTTPASRSTTSSSARAWVPRTSAPAAPAPADESQLHDVFPQIAIDLSNCGSLKIKKVDDLGAPMEGIQFGLFASEAEANAGTPLAQLPTDPAGGPRLHHRRRRRLRVPQGPAGRLLHQRARPRRWLHTGSGSPGRRAASTPSRTSTSPTTTTAPAPVDINSAGCEWFVNTLRTGTVVITKQVVDGDGDPITPTDITYLDGIAFELQDGGVTVQKRGGGDAACELVLDDPERRPRPAPSPTCPSAPTTCSRTRRRCPPA